MIVKNGLNFFIFIQRLHDSVPNHLHHVMTEIQAVVKNVCSSSSHKYWQEMLFCFIYICSYIVHQSILR